MMTVRRVRNILDHQPYKRDRKRAKDSIASLYFRAAMITLLLATVIFLLGLALIDYEVSSYYEEQPMINIVLPPEI